MNGWRSIWRLSDNQMVCLLDNLQEFLLELGKGFSFVARQKRITIDGSLLYRPGIL